MAHPFAPAAAELKALRNKLNFLTYQALFGRKLEDRQQASTDAVLVHDKIETVLHSTWTTAATMVDFSHSTEGRGGLYSTLDQFLELVESPKDEAGPQQSQPCTAMPSAFRA